MANWKKRIKVEVNVPYYTQNTCELKHQTYEQNISAEDIWFSGNDRDSRVWKAYIPIGEHPILYIGKTINTPKQGDCPTTYKVRAYCSCDGMTVGKEEYKVRVLSYE